MFGILLDIIYAPTLVVSQVPHGTPEDGVEMVGMMIVVFGLGLLAMSAAKDWFENN